MFGRKKDEGSEHFGDYYQEDNYGKADTGYDAEYRNDDPKQIIQPFLAEGEDILWLMCNGDPVNQNSSESDKTKNAVNKFSKAFKIIPYIIIISILVFIFGDEQIPILGPIVLKIAILVQVGYFIVFPAAVVIFIIWAIKKAPKNMCHAITDRRIISYGYSQLQEILLNDVTSTKAHANSRNKGRVVIRANGSQRANTIVTLVIPGVEDPYMVKEILDQAVEKCKAYNYQV